MRRITQLAPGAEITQDIRALLNRLDAGSLVAPKMVALRALKQAHDLLVKYHTQVCSDEELRSLDGQLNRYLARIEDGTARISAPAISASPEIADQERAPRPSLPPFPGATTTAAAAGLPISVSTITTTGDATFHGFVSLFPPSTPQPFLSLDSSRSPDSEQEPTARQKTRDGASTATALLRFYPGPNTSIFNSLVANPDLTATTTPWMLPMTNGTTDQVLAIADGANGALMWANSGDLSGAWSLLGNSGVTTSNQIGSINEADLKIITDNTTRMLISGSDGSITANTALKATAGVETNSIDTPTTTTTLSVGTAQAKELDLGGTATEIINISAGSGASTAVSISGNTSGGSTITIGTSLGETASAADTINIGTTNFGTGTEAIHIGDNTGSSSSISIGSLRGPTTVGGTLQLGATGTTGYAPSIPYASAVTPLIQFAHYDSTEVVPSRNSDGMGSASKTGTSDYTFTYKSYSSGFPTIIATTEGAGFAAVTTSPTATTVTVTTYDETGSPAPLPFNVYIIGMVSAV